MEKAEPYRKVLKVMCIFSIVYDLVMIALFSIVAAGLFDYDTAALLLGLPQDMLGGVSLASVMQTLGVMMIASQVIHLIGVLFVLHGVKNPAKMKPGMVLYGILSVFSIFGLIRQSCWWYAFRHDRWFVHRDLVHVLLHFEGQQDGEVAACRL